MDPTANSPQEPGSRDRDRRYLTLLLHRFAKGDAEAGSVLMHAIEAELRHIASRYMRKERQNHTLQTTALVNEAHLRLFGSDAVEWRDRNHFFAVAAKVMRQILIDYARSRKALKRAGQKVELDSSALQVGPIHPRILDVDRALTELATLAPRQARLVELRFFGGLSLEESAAVLEMAPRTADKDWALARAWLRRRLGTTPDKA